MKQSRMIYFVMALHNHQPVGNLSEVFDNSYQQTYEPFIATLEKYPGIKTVLHYSGSLLDWLMQNRPEFIYRLKALIQKGQVEILGGGYYEPILPAIPDADKIGQIEMMSSVLEEQFAARPKGLWLAERVWEPHLPRPISQAGIEYVTVDDAHFHDAGYHDLAHYFRTEEEGHTLDIFPISEELRYLIPFKPAHETIDFLNDRRDDAGQRLFVLADDGEKFGGWPGTYEAVYERGWLEQLFNMLEEQRDWLKVVTFSEYRSMFPPGGPVYLPTGSYREMKEWSGGFWRNFFSRYPESNRMHKKMLAVGRRLNDLPEGEVREQARRHLWAGQCNCAYWHGVFGGLYLNFLRAGIWENLLRADKLIDDALQNSPYIRISEEDRCCDGDNEIALDTDRISLLLSPQMGGSFLELSWRPQGVNLLDTITRKPEAYHKEYLEQAANPPSGDQVDSIHNLRAVKEEGIMEHLHYDPYQRIGFIEHFLEKEVSLEEFAKGSYHEIGDFLLKPAAAEIERLPGREGGSKGEGACITFTREAQLDNDTALNLKKVLTIYSGEDRFTVEYALTNNGGREKEVSFAVEQNLAFLGGDDDGRYYLIPDRELREANLASTGSESEVEQVELWDKWRSVRLSFAFERPALLWRAPIETISLSEGGLERSYQQSLLLCRWDLILYPGKSEKIAITAELSPVNDKTSERILVGSEAGK